MCKSSLTSSNETIETIFFVDVRHVDGGRRLATKIQSDLISEELTWSLNIRLKGNMNKIQQKQGIRY